MLTSPPRALSLLLLLACTEAAPSTLSSRDSVPLPPGTIDPGRTSIPDTVQICGLVAGYVGSVLIWAFLILTIGRKMRRKNQSVPKTLELELVTARRSGGLASPLSARSATSWFKKGFKKNDGSNLSVSGSQPQSPVNISSPTTMDQRTREIERERAQAEMERLYAAVAEFDEQKHMSQASADQEVETTTRRPAPKINTSQTGSFSSNPSSPVVAIYPPMHPNNPNNLHNISPPRDRLRDQPAPASPRSILSKKSHSSTTSNTSKTRFNLKKLRISSPVQKYPGGADDEEARTPLSPRFYNPPAPPSPPTQQNSPTNPGDFEAYEQLDEVQPLPRPAPQRIGSHSQTPTSPNYPPAKSANSSTNELPLRGYAEPLKSPDLRTTVLDRRLDKLSLNTPKTSVPYTPYSPYMPFTPITPVTPHLVTRSERKQKKKRQLAPQSLNEMVQSPKEIFGDAY